jgi:hypothetical protein
VSWSGLQLAALSSGGTAAFTQLVATQNHAIGLAVLKDSKVWEVTTVSPEPSAASDQLTTNSPSLVLLQIVPILGIVALMSMLAESSHAFLVARLTTA